ncbi:hypothetical protein [Nonomuraea sp. NPDC050643]|uniref:hypothetical protein n=1 Tax=Nonomuraea sp. NPDC050643 TaxID=3155660 RepID=UPI0033CD5D69
MIDQTVYRTRDESVLSAWRDAERQVADWRTRFDAGCVSLGIDLTQVIANTWSGRIKGVRHTVGDPIPDGWRYDKREGLLMPALRTPAGRRLAMVLDGLKRPMPADELPGMPYVHLTEGGLVRVTARLMGDGALYAEWPCRISESHGVDLTIWEPVKLSEYYAAREAADEAEQAGQNGGQS